MTDKDQHKLVPKSEDGKAISPVLPEEVKNYLIDIPNLRLTFRNRNQ